MSEAAIGIVVLIVLSAVCAAATHLFVRRPIAAALVAAIVASLLFQIVAAIHQGQMDKFVLIAFVVGAFWAFVIALLVGWLLRYYGWRGA
jgi:hypothetical protein